MTDRDYKTTIVIPSYNHWNLTQKLLSGLLVYEKDNIDSVVVSDDHSTDVSFERGISSWLTAERLPVVMRTNERNLGFLLTANAGLQAVLNFGTKRHILFLISNDVEIRGKFIEASAEFLLDKEKPGLLGNRLLSGNTGWNTFDNITFPYLEGYFLAATESCWRELDYFDPLYEPNDYEDVDLTTKAIRQKFRIGSLNSPAIYHEGGGTYGYTEERRLQTERNREKFRQKWM